MTRSSSLVSSTLSPDRLRITLTGWTIFQRGVQKTGHVTRKQTPRVQKICGTDDVIGFSFITRDQTWPKLSQETKGTQ